MLFDWASQPFFTVVTTFVFGPYFVAWIASDPASGQAMWGYAASAAGLVIAVFSPVLGSIADSAGPRKPWIVLFGLIQVAAMTALWWAVPGINPLWPLVFFAIATVCAEFAIVFNDSMMPALFARANLGKVSNLAWGLGYLGGMVMLIIVLAFFAASPETGRTLVGLVPAFGLDAASHAGDRACGPLAAIWYAVFILPLLVFTPDTPRAMAISRAVAHGLGELRDTIVSLHQRAALARFLVARMVYQDG